MECLTNKNKKIMNNFEQLLKANGITKQELGDIISIKGATIPKYVANPKLMRLDHIMKLSSQLGISTQELIRVLNNEAKFGIIK